MQTRAILAGAVLAHLVLLGGCYSPQLRDCTIQCGAASECADGQHCQDGWCVAPNVERCTEDGIPVEVDAAVGDSALPPDARDICEQGCSNGTCVEGVCTFDCSAPGSCPNDVICPANLPCRVTCGAASCGHKVNCSLASSCIVECFGDASCNDEIICGSGSCDVTCSGTDSCHRRTKCHGACECDVTCSGPGSCDEASDCPADACRVGNGCSSQPSGCSTCP